MSQAIIDPEEVRRFAAELKRFIGDLRERTDSLMARFTALGDTWQDQEQGSIMRNRQARQQELDHAKEEQSLQIAQAEADERSRLTEVSRAQVSSVIDADVGSRINELTTPWKSDVLPLFETLTSLENSSLTRFPAWTTGVCAG